MDMVPIATLASELGMTVGAVYTAVHRLRKRYRQILQDQIAATLDDPSEVEDEIRWLFEAFSAEPRKPL
jgi:RNA polymerase sigma-70 factor (ECF subfamily)